MGVVLMIDVRMSVIRIDVIKMIVIRMRVVQIRRSFYLNSVAKQISASVNKPFGTKKLFPSEKNECLKLFMNHKEFKISHEVH